MSDKRKEEIKCKKIKEWQNKNQNTVISNNCIVRNTIKQIITCVWSYITTKCNVIRSNAIR